MEMYERTNSIYRKGRNQSQYQLINFILLSVKLDFNVDVPVTDVLIQFVDASDVSQVTVG